MIAGGFDPERWTAIVIGLAVAAGAIRLLLWQRSAGPAARAPRWRLALLLLLQPVVGALLHFLLFPPTVATRTGTLVVATAGASRTISRSPGDVLVALPEAGAVDGATRLPDLATALRRNAGPSEIRIEGEGLAPRDQAPLPVPVAFDPPPTPRGIVELSLPEPVAPGAAFSVGGRIGALAAGMVELVDPAEAVVDRVRVAAGRRFVLAANMRAPGLALFALRLRDAAGGVVERIAVPVEARAQKMPRVLALAGAPGPESKYLRRWAGDAGIDLNSQVDVGGGVRIGDAPVPLARSTLQEVDLVVIDDRAWETLDADARRALNSAVGDGLGLLLRPTGPLMAATRRDWTALGVPLTGGENSRPLRLAPTSSMPAADPSADTGAESDADILPELARRDVAHEGPRAISLLRDADGIALASWRARGLGRVGVWTVTDSYALVLTDRPDRYDELWSALFSALARAGGDSRARIDGLAREGARLALCGLTGEARVAAPGGGERTLRIDPAAGEQSCAAYWPERSGWHLLRDGRTRETAFYVQEPNAARSLAAAANRQATLALAGTTPSGGPAPIAARAPGSPWPGFALLLTALALMWWLERRRRTLGTRPEAERRSRMLV